MHGANARKLGFKDPDLMKRLAQIEAGETFKDDKPKSGKARTTARSMTRGAALEFVARPVLAIAWAFVAWGSLLLLVTLWNAIGDGALPALGRLVPAHDASVWAWLNALSAGLALAVWLVGAAIYWVRRPSVVPDDPGT